MAGSGFSTSAHVVRLRPRRPPGSLRLQLRQVVDGARRLLQRGRAAQVLLHAGGVPRGHVLAVPQPRQRHVRGRHGDVRHLRLQLEGAGRGPASTTIRTAGPTSSWPTTRSRTSSIATCATASSGTSALEAGVALSEDGKARAGMGVDVAYLDGSRPPVGGRHQLRRRDDGALSRRRQAGVYRDRAVESGIGAPRATGSGSAACSRTSTSTAPWTWWWPTATSTPPSATSANAVGHAQPPHLFLNQRRGPLPGRGFGARARLRVARAWAAAWPAATSTATATWTCCSRPTTARPCCCATINWPATAACACACVGTTSNRDAIGALVRVFHGGATQTRMVKSGSSYLSQSELPLTFGVGRRDRVDRVVVTWPSGRTEEFANVATGPRLRMRGRKGAHRPRRSLRVTITWPAIATVTSTTGSHT